MKFTKVLSTAMLFLLPGAMATVYAQEHEEKQPAAHQQQAKPAAQHQEQAKPGKQEAARQTEAKPAKQQAAREQEAKPAKQQAARQQEAKPAKQQAARQQEAKPAKQQAARQQEAKPAVRERAGKPAESQRAQGQQQAAGRDQAAGRGQAAGGHGSIPDAKFRASFGSGHTFHVNRSEFASGSGRFQYGGFWFNAVNPWPVGWLYTDAVYVDYLNGGYFLCDPFHPGVYLSINVAI
jgi:hypothetical protein